MDFILKEVPICADKEFEMIKITDDVRKVVEESGVRKRNCLCNYRAYNDRDHCKRKSSVCRKRSYGMS